MTVAGTVCDFHAVPFYPVGNRHRMKKEHTECSQYATEILRRQVFFEDSISAESGRRERRDEREFLSSLDKQIECVFLTIESAAPEKDT